MITKNFDVYSVELAFIAWIADFFGRCRSIVGLSLEVVKSKLSIGFCDLFPNACFALLGISTRSPALASTQCNFPLASTSTSILPRKNEEDFDDIVAVDGYRNAGRDCSFQYARGFVALLRTK